MTFIGVRTSVDLRVFMAKGELEGFGERVAFFIEGQQRINGRGDRGKIASKGCLRYPVAEQAKGW